MEEGGNFQFILKFILKFKIFTKKKYLIFSVYFIDFYEKLQFSPPELYGRGGILQRPFLCYIYIVYSTFG